MIFDLTPVQLLTICFSSFIIGMSKTGIQGITAISVAVERVLWQGE